jgi:hypothetical protein
MAKKDATSPECHYYFDIQHESGNFPQIYLPRIKNANSTYIFVVL